MLTFLMGWRGRRFGSYILINQLSNTCNSSSKWMECFFYGFWGHFTHVGHIQTSMLIHINRHHINTHINKNKTLKDAVPRTTTRWHVHIIYDNKNASHCCLEKCPMCWKYCKVFPQSSQEPESKLCISYMCLIFLTHFHFDLFSWHLLFFFF